MSRRIEALWKLIYGWIIILSSSALQSSGRLIKFRPAALGQTEWARTGPDGGPGVGRRLSPSINAALIGLCGRGNGKQLHANLPAADPSAPPSLGAILHCPGNPASAGGVSQGKEGREGGREGGCRF